MNTTATITSQRVGTIEALLEVKGITLNVISNDEFTTKQFTVTFDDAETALKAVEKAKDNNFDAYLRRGGNARNKRSMTSQFTAVSKAIRAAA